MLIVYTLGYKVTNKYPNIIHFAMVFFGFYELFNFRKLRGVQMLQEFRSSEVQEFRH